MARPSVIDPQTFEEASFSTSAAFDHFANADHPNCFACNSRLMLTAPIAVNEDFILLPATTKLDDGRFVLMPGCWLVFPRSHVTKLDELPDNWTASVKSAVHRLGLEQPFNLVDNSGKQAGQTGEHWHTWIIVRSWNELVGTEEGLLSANTGLATILLRLKQYGITMPIAKRG